MSEEADYGLLVAFTDESPSFVNGFEAGKLWQSMEEGRVAEIEVTTHFENREVIKRMADNLGWEVECEATEVVGWDLTKLVKKRTERERPNPHGLRVVSDG